MNAEQRAELVAAISGYLYNSDEVLEAPDDAAQRIVQMVEQALAPPQGGANMQPEHDTTEFPLFLHSGGHINLFRSVARDQIALCFAGLDEGDSAHTQYSRLTRAEAQALIARLTDLLTELPEDN